LLKNKEATLAFCNLERVPADCRVVRRWTVIAAAVLASVACGRSGNGALDAGGDDAVYADSDLFADAAVPPCMGLAPPSHRIAFTGNVSTLNWQDVLVLDLDDGTPGCVNRVGELLHSDQARFMDWSQDGRVLAWVDDPWIYLTDVSGPPPWSSTVVSFEVLVRDIVWPVDHRLFVWQNITGNLSEIRAYGVEGASVTNEWLLSAPFVDVSALTTNSSGTGIVFHGQTSESGPVHIYWVDFAGSEPAAPERLDPDGVHAGFTAAWSPDDESVAFSAAVTFNVARLYVAAPSLGVPPVAVSPDVAGRSVWAHAWSHDGGMLAFEFSNNDVQELFVVDVTDGHPSGLRKVNNDAAGNEIRNSNWGWIGTTALYYVTGPQTFVADAAQATPTAMELAPGLVPQTVTPSPERSRIAFSAADDVMNTLDVWVVEVDGATPKPANRVTTGLGSGNLATPRAFSPDGRRLHYATITTPGQIWDTFSIDVGTEPFGEAITIYPIALAWQELIWAPDSTLLAGTGRAPNDNRHLHVADATQPSSAVVGAEALEGGLLWNVVWRPE
jgi:Tol biopolymer transport system component